MNEILLIISVLIYYTIFVLAYKYLGFMGIIIWNTLALVLANIEVLMLVNAFGITQTLGNVAFCSTSLVSDLVSEKYGPKYTKKVAYLGFVTTGLFVLITQLWLLFTPSEFDSAYPQLKALFQASPRIIIASLVVYVISQLFDISLFFKIWSYTKKLNPDPSKYLILRSTGSTIISQLFNSILFNYVAFYKVMPNSALIQVIISTFLIATILSVVGSPWLYWATKITPKKTFVLE
ncbi:MAG: queuosine precursor transporter [Bacilli bacterium]